MLNDGTFHPNYSAIHFKTAKGLWVYIKTSIKYKSFKFNACNFWEFFPFFIEFCFDNFKLNYNIYDMIQHAHLGQYKGIEDALIINRNEIWNKIE